MKSESIAVFRPSLAPLVTWVAAAFSLYLTFSLTLVTIEQLASGLFPIVEQHVGRLIVIGIAFVVTAAITCVIYYNFPVTVHEGGFRTVNFWGVFRSVSWQSITGVRRSHILGLGYLFISSSEAKEMLFIPLWLKDMEGFASLVEQEAGLDHLLARALREE